MRQRSSGPLNSFLCCGHVSTLLVAEAGFNNACRTLDFVWDKEKLDSFIAKPDEVVPGNNMKPYGGLASEDRTKLIAFLQSPTPD